MQLRSSLLVFCLTASTVARADVPHLADASPDLLNPRAMAMGEAGRGLATGDGSIGLNPSGVAFSHELVLAVDYGYRFSDSGSLVNASACDSTNTVPGCFYYHYTGASPDSAGRPTHSGLHVAGTTLAYPLTSNFSLGVGPKYYYFDTDDPGQTAAKNIFTFDAGATVKIGTLLSIGGAGYNLTTSTAEMPRAVGGGVVVKPLTGLTVAADARWLMVTGDHSIRYGGGANYTLNLGGENIPIAAGILHDNDLGATYVSGGLGFSSSGFGIDVAARFALDGERDTEILAAIRFSPVPAQ